MSVVRGMADEQLPCLGNLEIRRFQGRCRFVECLQFLQEKTRVLELTPRSWTVN